MTQRFIICSKCMKLNINFNITKRQPVLCILYYIIYYTFNSLYCTIVVGQVGPFLVATKSIYTHV